VFGVSLLATIGLTTESTAKWPRLWNALAVYFAWAAFAGGAILNGLGIGGERHLPALITLPALVFALGYHLRSRSLGGEASAASAG
jgi:hypothetical protein